MGMLLSQQVPRWFVLHACLDSVKRLLVFAKDCVLMLSCMCAGMDFGQLWCRPSSALPAQWQDIVIGWSALATHF
jgi:hypothetical protein